MKRGGVDVGGEAMMIDNKQARSKKRQTREMEKVGKVEAGQGEERVKEDRNERREDVCQNHEKERRDGRCQCRSEKGRKRRTK
jgi:hypothetical protein